MIIPDGYDLTNTHVVEKASKITVTLSGGETYDAEVVGIDKTSDLALLRLYGDSFPYAVLGDSDNLIIGEWVIVWETLLNFLLLVISPQQVLV